MKYYSATQKKDILPFVTTWMDLEGIMLSEINQTKTNTMGLYLHVESKKQTNKQINETKWKQTHRYREQKDGCQTGRDMDEIGEED